MPFTSVETVLTDTFADAPEPKELSVMLVTCPPEMFGVATASKPFVANPPLNTIVGGVRGSYPLPTESITMEETYLMPVAASVAKTACAVATLVLVPPETSTDGTEL